MESVKSVNNGMIILRTENITVNIELLMWNSRLKIHLKNGHKIKVFLDNKNF